MATFYRPHLRRLPLLVAAVLLSSAIARAKDQKHYQVIELGALGAALSYANGINDSGSIVGNVQYPDGHIQAFVWDTAHGIRRVDSTARQSVANCINNFGVIAGAAQDDSRIVDAVLWDKTGSRMSIAWAPFGAVATCVNGDNMAVGYREDGIFDVVDRAFSTPASDPNSAWNELFGPNHDSFANAINDRGQIVGSVDRQAFLLDPNGKLRILAGDPNADMPASAIAVNNRGDVLISQAGSGALFNGRSRTPLQSDAPLFPLGLNDRDDVVGYVDHGSHDAFVWSRDTGVQLLNDLIDTPGWQIFSANAINKSGMIAGYGVKNGRKRAVLLVPVKGPEPRVFP
jgi:uncharacterized membrane protein